MTPRPAPQPRNMRVEEHRTETSGAGVASPVESPGVAHDPGASRPQSDAHPTIRSTFRGRGTSPKTTRSERERAFHKIKQPMLYYISFYYKT